MDCGQRMLRREFYAYLAELLAAPLPTFDPGAARRQRGDRRISNARMLHELNVVLRFSSYRSGLRNCLEPGP